MHAGLFYLNPQFLSLSRVSLSMLTSLHRHLKRHWMWELIFSLVTWILMSTKNCCTIHLAHLVLLFPHLRYIHVSFPFLSFRFPALLLPALPTLTLPLFPLFPALPYYCSWPFFLCSCCLFPYSSLAPTPVSVLLPAPRLQILNIDYARSRYGNLEGVRILQLR